MQLAQFNWFVDQGLLTIADESRLVIHPEKYRDTVTALLREVLGVQDAGDKSRAAAFFEQWTRGHLRCTTRSRHAFAVCRARATASWSIRR